MDYKLVLCPCPRGDSCPQASLRPLYEVGGVQHHLHPTDPRKYLPKSGVTCDEAAVKQASHRDSRHFSEAWPRRECRCFEPGERLPQAEVVHVLCFECLKTCGERQKERERKMCRIVYRQLLCPCKRGDACPQNKGPVLPPLIRHSSDKYHHVIHPRSLQPDMCEPCAEAAACTATRGAAQPTCRDRTEEVASPPKLDSKPCPACRSKVLLTTLEPRKSALST
ncbi:hypothetical protein N3K66_000031 [Trichothecium roseum]|uniref:Uncharacterized protein n=1 Tax=Trichothecium roseum TaxID=47278 RepID=A0ACC0VC90_9HYPO|nr:hypothetical protein N3K66_000031 [Trichothecium roseum]